MRASVQGDERHRCLRGRFGYQENSALSGIPGVKGGVVEVGRGGEGGQVGFGRGHSLRARGRGRHGSLGVTVDRRGRRMGRTKCCVLRSLVRLNLEGEWLPYDLLSLTRRPAATDRSHGFTNSLPSSPSFRSRGAVYSLVRSPRPV